MCIYISTEYWPEHSLFGYGYGLDREIVTSEVFSWLKGFRHFSFSFIVDDIKLKNQEKHVKLSSNLTNHSLSQLIKQIISVTVCRPRFSVLQEKLRVKNSR